MICTHNQAGISTEGVARGGDSLCFPEDIETWRSATREPGKDDIFESGGISAEKKDVRRSGDASGHLTPEVKGGRSWTKRKK
jgi:hypothetical protein